MIQGQGEATTIPLPPVPQTPPVGQSIIVQESPMPPLLPPWMTLPPGVTLVIALGFFAACAIILRPLMTALGRRLEGRRETDPAVRDELNHLRARLEELEATQHRLLELEERVDFAERLLTTQRRESERLPGA